MGWFNIYGLIIIAIIMVPNIVFAIKNKEGFQNGWNNKLIETVEQIGRYGCFLFMIFNIPKTCFGWWFDGALITYLTVNFALVAIYSAVWCVCFRKSNTFRALSLSVLPSLIFLFSGILIRSILLIVSAVLFAPSHILISYKNAKESK